jgi:hypothetical protein
MDVVSRRRSVRVNITSCTLFRNVLTGLHSTKAGATVSGASLQLAHTSDMLVKVANFWAVQYAPALASHNKECILGMISLRSIVTHVSHVVDECWNVDVMAAN